MHYLLANFFKDLKCFGAKRGGNYFVGARADWLQIREDALGVKDGPSLIVDPTKGLCVLVCSKVVHGDSRQEFIHPCTHPISDNTPLRFPDWLAPCKLRPKLVRRGRTKKNNSSHDVYKLQGSGRGLDTFSINERMQMETLTTEESASVGFSLSERDDVRHHVKNHPRMGSEYIANTENSLNNIPDIDEKIKHAAKSGTYITREDAYHVWRSHANIDEDTSSNESDTESESNDESVTVPKNIIKILN